MSYLNTLTIARNSKNVLHHLKLLNYSVHFPTRTVESRGIVQKKPSSQQDGAAFLLSIAGMFSSSPSNTSENVKAIVAKAILSKYGEK